MHVAKPLASYKTPLTSFVGNHEQQEENVFLKIKAGLPNVCSRADRGRAPGDLAWQDHTHIHSNMCV